MHSKEEVELGFEPRQSLSKHDGVPRDDAQEQFSGPSSSGRASAMPQSLAAAVERSFILQISSIEYRDHRELQGLQQFLLRPVKRDQN